MGKYLGQKDPKETVSENVGNVIKINKLTYNLCCIRGCGGTGNVVDGGG
jgi:hypothetical protein